MNELYNPELIRNARLLRKNMTKEELHLWLDFLKGLPYKFLRQKPIEHYIVDFYCPELGLVIELDGGQHYTSEGIESDRVRDEFFSKNCLTVLRYSNADIRYRFEAVCEDILRHIESIRNK